MCWVTQLLHIKGKSMFAHTGLVPQGMSHAQSGGQPSMIPESGLIHGALKKSTFAKSQTGGSLYSLCLFHLYTMEQMLRAQFHNTYAAQEWAKK
jgi:hypothetical protein